MNSSLMTLIPKVNDSIHVSNFCPIVMGNFLYKIFTKIVATRLSSFIGDILSPSQYGFIPGCNIHTCIAISSETINSLHMGKHGNMAIKVDITKAFDTVNWDFIYQVLSCMGFYTRFIKMIASILNSARLSILINGTPQGYFACSRGVRQGDPLSPFFFCLAEEAFICWLDHYIHTGHLTTHHKLPRHLIYEDDILIFLEATRANGRCIKTLLDDYGLLSGQKHSPPKSSILYDANAPHDTVQYIKAHTCITTGYLPFKYLGVPIFRGAPKVEHLSSMTDSII